jgi:hypothetical protein
MSFVMGSRCPSVVVKNYFGKHEKRGTWNLLEV